MQRDQAHKTNELLERIAIALEKNTANVVYNGELKNIEDLGLTKDVKYKVKDNQLVPDIPGFEGTLKDLHDLKLHTDEGPQDDDSIHNDYLMEIVEDMNKIEYLQFCHEMGYVSNDELRVTSNINELEYEECLGAIKTALFIKGDDDYVNAYNGNEEAGTNYVKDQLDGYDNLNQDPYTYDNDLTEYCDGIKNDSDHDIRSTAAYYEDAMDSVRHRKLKTKKDAILDYVTNEFGILGARYTDIIKFAYYLGSPNAPKYTSANRGYYSCAFSSRMNGHLIQGGKDQLVKGINNEGDERYYALSYVDQATDYYKRLDI